MYKRNESKIDAEYGNFFFVNIFTKMTNKESEQIFERMENCFHD